MDEEKSFEDVGGEPWIARSVFVVEDESVGPTDGMKCLSASEVIRIDFVAEIGKVLVEDASPVTL